MLENFIRSLRKHDFNYIWLGKGKKWKNFKFKSELLYNHLPNNDDLVIISDAYDVLVNRNSLDLKNAFSSYKKDILVGSEWYCGNKKNCKPIEKYWNLQDYTPPKKYCNAGFVMGISKEVKKMYKYLLEYNDDQLGLSNYINENPKKFAIDHSNFIIQNIHVLDTVINQAYFYHFPGPLLKYGLFPQYNIIVKRILGNNNFAVYPNEIYYLFAFIVFSLIILIFYK